MGRWAVASLLVAAAFLCGRAALAQQTPVPGVTGTLALEGTVDKTYAGADTLVVAAADGIKHLFHWTKRTVVHGASDADAEALSGLTAGSRVVVHYALDGAEQSAVEVDKVGDEGLKELRGVVTRVDRDANEIAIRLDDGSHQTLELSDRAAHAVGRDVDESARVAVYYADHDGKRVAHYFTRIGHD